MDLILDCFFGEIFSNVDRGGLLARYKRAQIVEYLSTVIEGCSSSEEPASTPNIVKDYLSENSENLSEDLKLISKKAVENVSCLVESSSIEAKNTVVESGSTTNKFQQLNTIGNLLMAPDDTIGNLLVAPEDTIGDSSSTPIYDTIGNLLMAPDDTIGNLLVAPDDTIGDSLTTPINDTIGNLLMAPDDTIGNLLVAPDDTIGDFSSTPINDTIGNLLVATDDTTGNSLIAPINDTIGNLLVVTDDTIGNSLIVPINDTTGDFKIKPKDDTIDDSPKMLISIAITNDSLTQQTSETIGDLLMVPKIDTIDNSSGADTTSDISAKLSPQTACKKVVIAALNYHDNWTKNNSGICLRGKYHDVLYIACALCFKWNLQDTNVVVKILRTIYSCEKTFEKFFEGSLFGIKITQLISGWKSDYRTREENVRALRYFLRHATIGKLTFPQNNLLVKFVDVPMNSYGQLSPIKLAARTGRWDIFDELLRHGALTQLAEGHQLFQAYDVSSEFQIYFLSEMSFTRNSAVSNSYEIYESCGILKNITQTLKHLCRVVIRRELNESCCLPYGIYNLGTIPPILQSYLDLR